MSTCPRCHATIINSAKFCNKCGLNISYVNHEVKPLKKLEFHNVSFNHMQDWLYQNSKNMILENAKARIRFDETGIFFKNYEWYFEDLTLWYRMGNNPYPNHLAYMYRGTTFAQLEVNEFINSQLSHSRKVILNCGRSAYLPGGILSCCKVVIFN